MTMEVTVRYTKTKRLVLRVTEEGRVTVSAPRGCSREEIRRFISQKEAWIETHVARALAKRNCHPFYADEGATVRFGGEECLLLIKRHKGRPEVVKTDGQVLFLLPETDSAAKQQTYRKRACKDVLAKQIAARLPVWENVTGLSASSWSLRDMKTRWGSCCPKKGKITFSLLLSCESPAFLDYVILHELAHLRYANHGPEFWGFVEKYMPGAKKYVKSKK